MKRMLFVFLAAASLLLTACGLAAAPVETPALVSPALTAQLNLLRNGVQPGTAGSSLKAATVAADLLDWASAPPAQESIDATVRDWLAAQSEETLSLLPQQLESLAAAVAQLTEDFESAAPLLEDAGLTGRGPWSAEAGAQAQALLLALQPAE